jgi:hypothetical protein
MRHGAPRCACPWNIRLRCFRRADVRQADRIDLGTVNVIVTVHGKGVVLNEPSVVAISLVANKILAVGNERAPARRTRKP